MKINSFSPAPQAALKSAHQNSRVLPTRERTEFRTPPRGRLSVSSRVSHNTERGVCVRYRCFIWPREVRKHHPRGHLPVISLFFLKTRSSDVFFSD